MRARQLTPQASDRMRIAPSTYSSPFSPSALRVLLVLVASLTIGVCASSPCAFANSSGGAGAPTGTTPATGVHPTGIATWFGPGFYGKQTACGQTLTPGVVGVANRTLPCGTLIKITYKSHTLTLPVLDRGPYGHDADWDLTAGAAEALGITETVRIATHVVGRTANTPALGLPPGSSSAAMTGGALAAEPS